jgi:hypothetical protein
MSSTKQIDGGADHVHAEADDGSSSARQQAEEDDETVHEDDLCPICQLLLFRPVTTLCNHTLCESCNTLPL